MSGLEELEEALQRVESLKSDRDAWKAHAEKYREALREISNSTGDAALLCAIATDALLASEAKEAK